MYAPYNITEMNAKFIFYVDDDVEMDHLII